MAQLNLSTLGSLNATVDAENVGNIGTISVVVGGTWSGTITFQGSSDGTNFDTILGLRMATRIYTGTTTSNGTFVLNCVGMKTIRIKMTSYTSGTANIEMQSSIGGMVNSLDTIQGGTDATIIGNVVDRLKVDASFVGSKTRIVDMNASSGGVARGTNITSTSTYTTLFNYSGTGQLFSFLVTFEGNLVGADAFNIKLEIDNVIVLEISTADVGTNTLYNLLTDGDESTMGMALDTNVFRFAAPHGIGLYYGSSVKVSIKKVSSTAAKAFRAGMVYMTKET